MPTIPPTESDWQTGKSLMECTEFMLENEIACDVTFLTGEAKDEVRAHKFILISRSPVFSAMFCGAMAETEESIPIPHIHADTFRTMLRYMYCDKANIDLKNVAETIYCAKKYGVAGLINACREYLSKNMKTSNACLFLRIANISDEQDLSKLFLSSILKNGEECLQSGSFTQLGRSLVEKILEADDLTACELSVWKALVRWSVAECERQEVTVNDVNIKNPLGELVYLIRFRGIDYDTLTKKITSSEILTGNEIGGLFRFVHGAIAEYDKFSTKKGRAAPYMSCIRLSDRDEYLESIPTQAQWIPGKGYISSHRIHAPWVQRKALCSPYLLPWFYVVLSCTAVEYRNQSIKSQYT
ncbi:hypothetical protein ScPMuIL_006370 [Solemya velum]